MKRTSKLWTLLIAVVMLVSLFTQAVAEANVSAPSGIADPDEVRAASATLTPDPDAMVIYNIYAGPENDLNPYLLPSYDFMRQVFCSPLVMKWTDQKTGETHYDCILAESIEANEDQTEFTIHIRPEVKWHDGVPFTAHDVVYSVTQIWTDDDILYSMYYGRCPEEGEWTEVDEKTVNVTFKKPFLGFFDYLFSDLVVCPAHIFEGIHGAAFNEFAFEGAPIGNGPFKYVEHVPSEYWLLERYEDYIEPAKIKYLRLQFIREDSIAVMALQAGDLDITRTWDAITNTLIADPDIRVYQIKDRTTYCLCLNTGENDAYHDANVRKALACLVDKVALCSSVLGNMAIPKQNFIDSWTPGYNEAFNSPYVFNPEQAKAYLEEAGYSLGVDGFYQKDGTQLVINFDNSGGPGSEKEKIGLTLQAEAKKIGLKLLINNYDDESWKTKREAATISCFTDKLYFYADDNVINSLNAAISEMKYWFERDRNKLMIFGDKNLAASMESLLADMQAAADSKDEAACQEQLNRLWIWLNKNANLIPIYESCTAFSARNTVHIEDCKYLGSSQLYFNRIWVEK